MFVNFISKLLNILVHPLGWILLMVILAGRLKSRTAKRWLYGGALVVFLLFTNRPLYKEVENAWNDRQVTPWPTRHYTYCFIPGGMTAGYDQAYETVGYREAVDRMTTAALFVKEGICDTIVVSGDGASCWNGGNPEGFAAHAERLFGIDRGRIKCERFALTTMQNFQYSIPMMQCGDVITVNSARYMERTKLCAELINFETDYFTVQHVADRAEFVYLAVDFLPDWGTIDDWYKLMHEWFGYMWYLLLYSGGRA